MGKHRAEPPPRVRPRTGRIAAAGLALTVTLVALLGGIGVIPVGSGAGSRAGADPAPQAAGAASDLTAAQKSVTAPTPTSTPTPTPTPTPMPTDTARTAASTSLPAGSGSGRRVVFSEEAQRVWLVDAEDRVVSTYLVSGSVTDNLHPGSYAVYSRSRWAVGVDDSGVMQYFVRFTRGDNAAIGFHSIPSKGGVPLQTEAQLGTPQSHGCIRQKLADAQRLWDFADVGTDVVVV
ncbi:L,D-transpeptidase [Marmoricola sp. RAF53]|uniref:L,D-transpeptidase n=1 Tax=Marmoricola sp. RAF53 TaxID=3233059 RepID=UPI003F966D07